MNTIRHPLRVSALALAACACAAVAAAPNPAAAVKARQANYKEIGGAFKTINDELKSGSPDMNALRPLARVLAVRATRALDYFPKGSGPESRVPTRAKPEIWKSQPEFVRMQRGMIAAANSFNAAATAGNVAQMQRARVLLGETCKSCHDRFRVPG